jgi:hypothetical protein
VLLAPSSAEGGIKWDIGVGGGDRKGGGGGGG